MWLVCALNSCHTDRGDRKYDGKKGDISISSHLFVAQHFVCILCLQWQFYWDILYVSTLGFTPLLLIGETEVLNKYTCIPSHLAVFFCHPLNHYPAEPRSEVGRVN